MLFIIFCLFFSKINLISKKPNVPKSKGEVAADKKTKKSQLPLAKEQLQLFLA